MMTPDTDVLIIGAGLSGIGAAVQLEKRCNGKSYRIVEGRQAMGGTWDVFRYPGIRSDSDMYTLGYNFKPWTRPKAIADGPSIRAYIRETAEEYGVTEHIQFNTRVIKANWSTPDQVWHVTTDQNGKQEVVTCRFLFMNGGYYSYKSGYRPDFPGEKNFKGKIVHPQQWPEDLDYSGKKVVIIGSGATAVTLVPAMAETAAHVTMLQRSPTYVVSRPGTDKLANVLKKFLPAKWAYNIIRKRNIAFSAYFFNIAREKPEETKARLRKMLSEHLPEDEIAKHFTPTYNPWDQRICLVPDGDLFDAMKSGKAGVVTDHIEQFDETGIKLQSGGHLDADIIVTATGLNMIFLNDVDVSIDNKLIDPSKTLNYKGVMLSNVPNLACTFGYTNASWTLKADLTSEYVARLLNHMDENGYTSATPVLEAFPEITEPFMDFSSGYVARAMENFPRQHTEKPWKLNQNYKEDVRVLRKGDIVDDIMTFHTSETASAALKAAE
ncbi:MAG: flavin-containing monooxygenase [Hyphomonas sp.]